MARIDDDTLITTALLRRFMLEAAEEGGDGRFCAYIERSNGDLVRHAPGSPPCIGEQSMFAADMLKVLNRELHHDGAWVIVFTHPGPSPEALAILSTSMHAMYRRYVLLWLDEDGDVQLPVDWVEGESEMLDFYDVLMTGIVALAEQCEAAWTMWDLHMNQVIERKKGVETFQRARGERPKTKPGAPPLN